MKKLVPSPLNREPFELGTNLLGANKLVPNELVLKGVNQREVAITAPKERIPTTVKNKRNESIIEIPDLLTRELLIHVLGLVRGLCSGIGWHQKLPSQRPSQRGMRGKQRGSFFRNATFCRSTRTQYFWSAS